MQKIKGITKVKKNNFASPEGVAEEDLVFASVTRLSWSHPYFPGSHTLSRE